MLRRGRHYCKEAVFSFLEGGKVERTNTNKMINLGSLVNIKLNISKLYTVYTHNFTMALNELGKSHTETLKF